MALAELLALLGFSVSRLSGYPTYVDLHPEDELVYLFAGLDLWHGHLPSVGMAPAYTGFAAVLAWFAAPAAIPDLAYLLVGALAPMALWWALRRLPMALPIAVWFASSPVLLQAAQVGTIGRPHVYTFQALLAAMALGAFRRGRFGWGAVGLLAMVVNRAEVGPWCLVAAGLVVVGRQGPARKAAVPLLVAAAVCTVGLMGAPAVRARSWLAFRQHYAPHVVQRELAAEWSASGGRVDPERLQAAHAELLGSFAAPDRVVQRDFPGAESLADAAWIAPGRLLGFLASNLEGLPEAVYRALGSTLPLGDWHGLLLGLAALAALFGWRFGRRPEPTPQQPLLVALVGCCPVALLPLMAVGPRAELVLGIVPWLFLPIAAGTARLVSEVGLGSVGLRCGWVGLTCLAMVAPRPFHGPPPALPMRDALALWAQVGPEPGRAVVVATGLAPLPERLLVGPGVRCVPVPDHPAAWSAFLADQRVDRVLWTHELEARFPAATGVSASLHVPPWRELGRRGTAVVYGR